MRYVRVVGLVVAGLVVAGCSGGGGGVASKGAAPTSAVASPRASSATSAPARADAKGDVRITKSGVEDHPVWGPHAYVVHYAITNHGTGPADYFAQLEFLDADGDHLGTTGITADKLGVGKTKADDIAPLDVEIENGKVADIRSVRVSEVDRTPAA